MSVWARLGRGAWRLHRAPARRDDEPPPPTSGLTAREAGLLLRYLAARVVLAWLWGPFGLAYLVLAAVGALVWWATGETSDGVVAVVLIAAVGLAHWLVARPLRRFGRVRQLGDLDDIGQGALVSWWPNLRRELRRVGLAGGITGIARLSFGLVRGRLSPAQRSAVGQIDWPRVLPRTEWRRARQVLSGVARGPTGPGDDPGADDLGGDDLGADDLGADDLGGGGPRG
jgi:hypothetical protein